MKTPEYHLWREKKMTIIFARLSPKFVVIILNNLTFEVLDLASMPCHYSAI